MSLAELFICSAVLLLYTPITAEKSCPLVDPPIDLGSGALDQLIDVLLQYLLSNKSVIRMNQPVELSDGIEMERLRVQNLQSIRRTCAVQLTTRDAAGCHQRGFLLDACFGFDELLVNASLTTWIPGLRKGDYHISLTSMSVRMLIELFPHMLTGNGLPLKSWLPIHHPVAHVAQLETVQWAKISVTSLTGGVSRRLLMWFISNLLNMAKRSIFDRLDWLIRRAINEELRTFRLHPFFVPAIISHNSQRAEDKTTNVHLYKPKEIFALPIV
ncbi:hypothetical protein CSKR_110769 [Clonorchis sinensis]|uniref:Secreted protein n=1 Tax=Clonorchis sinensis TaxID=79923 RepID=A0A8T1LZB2_CLOSI|nr:hypothetical protein CSKR_110769 [Clonorchis sinensis]